MSRHENRESPPYGLPAGSTSPPVPMPPDRDLGHMEVARLLLVMGGVIGGPALVAAVAAITGHKLMSESKWIFLLGRPFLLLGFVIAAIGGCVLGGAREASDPDVAALISSSNRLSTSADSDHTT